MQSDVGHLLLCSKGYPWSAQHLHTAPERHSEPPVLWPTRSPPSKQRLPITMGIQQEYSQCVFRTQLICPEVTGPTCYTRYQSEFVTQLYPAPQLSQLTKLCIHQNACIANHSDTPGSNNQVKMFLMSCSYCVSWWLQISTSVCIYNFLDCFCLFVYSERFPCTCILPCRLLLSPRQCTTPEGTGLHRTFTTSSNPSPFSGMNQCQWLCLYLASASSSERKHCVSPTLLSHTH